MPKMKLQSYHISLPPLLSGARAEAVRPEDSIVAPEPQR